MSGKPRPRARSVEEKDYAALQAQLRAAANRREVLRDAGGMPGEHQTPVQRQLNQNRNSNNNHSAAASSSHRRPSFSPQKESPRVRFTSSESGTAATSSGSSKNMGSRGHNSFERETSRERPNPAGNSTRYAQGWTSKFISTSSQRAHPCPPETAGPSWLSNSPSYSFPQPHTQQKIRSHGSHGHQHAQRKPSDPRAENGKTPVVNPPSRATTGLESNRTHRRSTQHLKQPSPHHPQPSPHQNPEPTLQDLPQPLPQHHPQPLTQSRQQPPPQHHPQPTPARPEDIYVGAHIDPSSWIIYDAYGNVLVRPIGWMTTIRPPITPTSYSTGDNMAAPRYVAVDPDAMPDGQGGPAVGHVQPLPQQQQQQQRPKIRQPRWDDGIQGVTWEWR